MMSKQEEKIDELIKEALSAEEAKFYDELGEQNLIEKIGELHKGKMGWLAIIMNIFNLVVLAALIYSLVQFFNADQTNELIKWASSGFLCMIFMSMIKLYNWMQMDKNDILRELKRIELQVSTLINSNAL